MMVVLSLSDNNLLGAAQVAMMAVSSLRPVSSVMTAAAGQDGDILQHGLAAIAKARGLDGQHVEHAAQLVQHQGRQRFAVDVFGDDDQVALADLDQFLEQRDDVRGGGDLLVVDQDVRLGDRRLPCARDR